MIGPSIGQARDAFAARRAVEAGMPREASIVRDAGKFLLADFPVCLVECRGHRVLCDLLRDLTARTNLVASLYQSTHDMRQSGADHARTDTAPVAGDAERAA